MGGDLLVLRGDRVADHVHGKYIVARVARLEGDTAELQLGKYVYDLASRAERAADRASAEEFSEETVVVPRVKLVEWEQDGGLSSVVRK